MRFNTYLAAPLVVALLTSCGSELPPGKNPEPAPAATPGIPKLGLFALKASSGAYVSCSMTPDSTGLVTLNANRTTISPNEVFTGWYGEDGRMGIKAPNGKYVSVDRNNGGLLVAAQEYVGDWETFELVDAGNGRHALKNSNGQFVCAHYELPGQRAAALVADRPEAFEWEWYTIIQDPAIGQ